MPTGKLFTLLKKIVLAEATRDMKARSPLEISLTLLMTRSYLLTISLKEIVVVRSLIMRAKLSA